MKELSVSDSYCNRNCKMLSFTVSAMLLLSSASMIAAEEFSYSSQDTWGGVCVNGNLNYQSPINILKQDVVQSSTLIPLQLSGWDVGYDGKFVSTGHNVQFNPSSPGQATTNTYAGVYELQQVHMHWGRWTGEGSEHAIDGRSNELEIHFVHTKRGGSVTDGNYYAVIGVMAEVDYAKPCGPWEELFTFGDVQGFRFDSLLPKDLEYYFYFGSLTTPPCSENVNWYVLKTKIRVPEEYLKMLRTSVFDSHNNLLKYNYRNLQNLGPRRIVVTTTCQA